MGKEKKYSREELVGFFKRGSLPTDEAFKQLIYSNYNKADDKLDITEKLGLQIYPVETGKLLNFFEDADDENPEYEVSISPKGLFIQRVSNLPDDGNEDEKQPEIFIKSGELNESGTGNVGIGLCEPKSKLDVNGIITSKGRLGTYQEGELLADGHWHNAFDKELQGVHAFEVMAFAKGNVGEGKYSILHAIVTCTFGKGKSRITATRSRFRANDRIEIRVVSKPTLIESGKGLEKNETGLLKSIFRWFKLLFEPKGLKYNLQLRTKRHFGKTNGNSKSVNLFYKITLLWGPNTIKTKAGN